MEVPRGEAAGAMRLIFRFLATLLMYVLGAFCERAHAKTTKKKARHATPAV